MVNHMFNHHLWNIFLFFFQRPNSRKSKNLDHLCANQKLDPAKKIGLIRTPGTLPKTNMMIQVKERNHTVDGRNPVPVDMENMPCFHRVPYRYITGGAGFLPATVSCKMSLGCEMHLKKKYRFIKSSSLQRGMAMWWFETFFIFTPTHGDDPIWRTIQILQMGGGKSTNYRWWRSE